MIRMFIHMMAINRASHRTTPILVAVFRLFEHESVRQKTKATFIALGPSQSAEFLFETQHDCIEFRKLPASCKCITIYHTIVQDKKIPQAINLKNSII